MRTVRATLALFLLISGATAAGEGFEWDLPPGFPVPRVPDDNPMTEEKVELGRYLFYDQRLSGSGDYACASCHQQARAFTDGRARAVGATGEHHRRSAMSLANVAYNASLTWADPQMRRLESQAAAPMFNEHPIELGVGGNERVVVERLRDDPRYREMFRRAFPDDLQPVTLDNVIRAVASFERTLISGGSPYNRLVYGGEMDALSDAAREGMRLFFSDALQCGECHAGFSLSGPVDFASADPPIEPVFHNTGLYDTDGAGSYPREDTGLSETTGRIEDMGRFRAPTLYNIALTAPYMHDGSISTLDEVIEFYASGGRLAGRGSPYKDERLDGFSLSDEQRAQLVAFLNSLTDMKFVRDRRFGDPFSTP